MRTKDAEVSFCDLRPGDLIISPSGTRFIISVVPTMRDDTSIVNITFLYRRKLDDRALLRLENGIYATSFFKDIEIGRMFSDDVILLRADS